MTLLSQAQDMKIFGNKETTTEPSFQGGECLTKAGRCGISIPFMIISQFVFIFLSLRSICSVFLHHNIPIQLQLIISFLFTFLLKLELLLLQGLVPTNSDLGDKLHVKSVMLLFYPRYTIRIKYPSKPRGISVRKNNNMKHTIQSYSFTKQKQCFQ